MKQPRNELRLFPDGPHYMPTVPEFLSRQHIFKELIFSTMRKSSFGMLRTDVIERSLNQPNFRLRGQSKIDLAKRMTDWLRQRARAVARRK